MGVSVMPVMWEDLEAVGQAGTPGSTVFGGEAFLPQILHQAMELVFRLDFLPTS